MHRLRIEFGGKIQNFLARHPARSEPAQMAKLKIFKKQGRHDGDNVERAGLWQQFVASSTCRTRGSSPTCPNRRSELGPWLTGTGCARITLELPGEPRMFDFQDLFQWDRFITPTIIKTFYWLVIALIGLFGISGILSGLAAMAINPFGGFIQILSSIAGVIVGVIFSRISAELILIVFRINEHLGAIRDQGSGHFTDR
jgi:hypothetical protein